MGPNRRRRRKNRIFRLGGAALVLLVLLGVLFLFRADRIQVYGNERHSSEEISAGLLDNVLLKNTLCVLWRYRDGEVPDNMRYLSSLHVQLKSPSRLDVHVTEKLPVAYLEKDGYVYINEEGVVQEISDQVYDGVPIITGITVEEPVLYQKLPAQSSAQLRTILSLTQLFAEQALSVEEIRFSDNMEIVLYVNNIEVQLGQDEYLEEKIANLAKILPRLEGQSGVLHLDSFTGRNEKVPFTPAGSVTRTDGDSDDAGTEGQEEGDSDDEGQADGDGSGGQDAEDGDGQADGENAGSPDDAAEEQEDQNSGTIYPMVFNSSGTLVYNVHVENGVVVDEYGNPVPGVTVNENGNVVDAYMNVFDPATGELIQ